MNQELLDKLFVFSEEELAILNGDTRLNKEIYMNSDPMVIDKNKLLEAGKLIQVRTHTRFIHFPPHRHNYVEVVYMCQGETRHKINGNEIVLKKGELLFLNQNALQEIYPAGEQDIAINFIILPEFFDEALQMTKNEENLLREFVIGCLRNGGDNLGYLHFKVAKVLPIQNLVENLIWTLTNEQKNQRSINQITMGILFLQLMNHIDKVATSNHDYEQELILTILSYIEENYRDGRLQELALKLKQDDYWLSKTIKKLTGKTYTELVQIKRLNQAAFLLVTTKLNIMEIGMAVGYDNISYFHRIFYKKFKMTPREYRHSR